MRRLATFIAAVALVVAGMAVSPGRAAAIPLGPWHEYNGHWYTQLNDISWLEAENFAVTHGGGHLVTVNTEEEQNWLASTFTDEDLSIGFNDIDAEGTWVWTSGEEVTYTNWNDGEPNNTANEDNNFAGENIAVMNWMGGGSQWNDLSDNYRAIIESPVPFAENDFFVDPTEIWGDTFDDSPDMAIAGFEADEPMPCDTGTLEGSVWYRFWNPALSGLRIEIGGDQDNVTAALYGPFFDYGTSVGDLSGMERGCVYGVGPDQAWTGGIEAGLWYIQLSSSHAWSQPPSIHVQRNYAWFWVNSESIDVASATVDRAGNITFSGTAVCELQWSNPDPEGGYPMARWNPTDEFNGYYSYDLDGWASQALGRKTLLQGGGRGYIDCMNTDENGRNTWWLWIRAGNGKFGPNATNVDLTIGGDTCNENGCFFYGFANFYDYVKVTKAR